jgi:hypothetical protein
MTGFLWDEMWRPVFFVLDKKFSTFPRDAQLSVIDGWGKLPHTAFTVGLGNEQGC